MNEVMVGELREFSEGGYRVLRVEDFEFGIFRHGERLVAYENRCPHDGGPVCQGKVIPRASRRSSRPTRPAAGFASLPRGATSCARGTAGSSTSRPAVIAAIRNTACVRSTCACGRIAST